MHALVATVLLRSAGHDAVEANSQLGPPDGQPAEPSHGMRSERQTVVCEDGLGQSVLTKTALESLMHGLGPRVREALAAEQVTREAVCNSQRETPRAIAELKLAFEVGAPGSVRRAEVGLRRLCVRMTCPPWLAANQPMALEELSDGARGGQALNPAPCNRVEDRPRSPMSMRSPCFEQQLLDLSADGVRVCLGSPGPIVEAPEP